MRGYFAIGVERISKPMNMGNLMRSAHAFGASFFFAVAPESAVREARHSDTADSSKHLPLYIYETIDELALPRGCVLVGVEFTDDAVVLPSFHHPSAAAYIFGPERGSLSAKTSSRCAHIVKIPTKFCVNVGVAGAIVMYDRVLSRGGFVQRPLNPRAEGEAPPRHVSGAQRVRGPRPAARNTKGAG
ncbi:MAG: RNA methyltransferase [Alphaproteobacteria bacterium]